MQDRLIKIDALESCVEMFDCYGDFEKQINEIFDSIESLEQQNTALQQERANMQTIHRNTIAKLEARIKEQTEKYCLLANEYIELKEKYHQEFRG